MSQKYFDEVAGQWDQMRQEFFSVEVRERAIAEVGVAPGMAVLDVGAGSGFVSEALLVAGAHVHALDASPEMVVELTRRFPTVKARVGDAEALPYPVGSFDRVFANMCLHHVERPAAALAEWTRVLRPGGRLVVTDLDAHEHTFLRDEQHDRWMGFERSDVAKWLAAAGLRGAHVGDLGASCCAASTCCADTAKISIFLARGEKPLGKMGAIELSGRVPARDA